MHYFGVFAFIWCSINYSNFFNQLIFNVILNYLKFTFHRAVSFVEYDVNIDINQTKMMSEERCKFKNKRHKSLYHRYSIKDKLRFRT